MIELGKKQKLFVKRIKEFGVYLGEQDVTDTNEDILMPAKYVPEGLQVGDGVEVFVYRDSSDRLVATTIDPAFTLGETAVLEVTDVSSIGVFLDWGLEKDLLLPFREQTVKTLSKGQKVLVALYIDKSMRLCATMRVYDYLRCDSPYKKGDTVKCVIYQFNSKLGAFAAVDGIYHAMFPSGKYHHSLNIGDEIEARVENTREDGKLELTQIAPIREQINSDAGKTMELIDSYDGVLPFTEKADPEVIQRELGMSKAAFKRAVGHLLKERKIEIDNGKIRKI